MGRHSKRKRSTNAASKDHFPIGELATKRKQIREEYLKKCQVLQVEEAKLKKTTAKVGKFKKNLSVYAA